MSKSNFLENAILGLIFNAAPIANLADNAASSPLANLYVSLHTGDPGEGGAQNASECAYGSYARVAVARNSGGWILSGNVISPAADIVFAQPSSGSETATHFAIGVASSGAGAILYRGALAPTIAISPAMTIPPTISSASTVTED